MAKKKAARNPAASKSPADDGKVAFQIRLDADLQGRMKEVAEKAGLSLNQLIQGMCRGLIDHAVVGEVRKGDDGFVGVRDTPKCVFFGKPGAYADMPEWAWEEHIEQHGKPPEPLSKGWVWFGLDFTERGVVGFDPR